MGAARVTVGGVTPGARSSGTWDELAAQLMRWRRAAGEPSFTEIAQRIGRQRQDAGVPPAAARVGRTTVYDTFRTGRRRVNLELVREIATALGVSGPEVDDAITRCLEATDPEPIARPSQPAPDDPRPVLAGPPVPGVVADTAPEAVAADVAPVRGAGEGAGAGAMTPRGALLLMLGCLLFNLLGRVIVDFLGLPLYLDMVGTAVAAIALGPWRGATVGLGTNVVGAISSGWVSLPFALVNIAGALVWGYGVRRGLGRTLPRFLGLNALVALACTLIAVPVLLALGGSTGHGEDAVTDTLLELTHTLAVAVGFSNVVTSLSDKVISGFVALVVVSALPIRAELAARLPLAADRPELPPRRS